MKTAIFTKNEHLNLETLHYFKNGLGNNKRAYPIQ